MPLVRVSRYGDRPIYSDLTPPSGSSVMMGAELRELGAAEHFVRPYDPATYRRLKELDEEDREAFVRYCEELDCLHEDIAFILFELEGAVTLFYRDNLDLKRLALVYHEDNFYFRVHAYREKLFKLINHGFGFKIPDRPDRSKKDPTPGFHNEIRTRLKQQRVEKLANLVDGLWTKEAVPKVLHRRNRLAHSLAERDWKTITTTQRMTDRVEVRSEIDDLDKVTDLDRLHERKQEELRVIQRRLDQFRGEFVTALQELGF